MAYPPPPSPPPSGPPQPPSPYQPWGYQYPPPSPSPGNPLLMVGVILTIIGGILVGVGWLLPIQEYYIVVGVGWILFGPGLGLALLAIAQQRSQSRP